VRPSVQAAGVLPEPEDAEPPEDSGDNGDDYQDESDVVDVHGSNHATPDIAPPVAEMTALIDILPIA
jgi:hypothetical protein